MCSCPCASYDYHERGYFSSFCNDVIDEHLIFCGSLAMDSSKNMSLHYVNFINCMMSYGVGGCTHTHIPMFGSYTK